MGTYTPENERLRPLKRDYFRREYIFQALIFRGHVSFQGSITVDGSEIPYNHRLDETNPGKYWDKLPFFSTGAPLDF